MDEFRDEAKRRRQIKGEVLVDISSTLREDDVLVLQIGLLKESENVGVASGSHCAVMRPLFGGSHTEQRSRGRRMATNHVDRDRGAPTTRAFAIMPGARQAFRAALTQGSQSLEE